MPSATTHSRCWVVHVVLTLDAEQQQPHLGALIELLRYAGCLAQLEDAIVDSPEHELGYARIVQFDVLPPSGIDARSSRHWAERNAERMASFDVLATARELPR